MPRSQPPPDPSRGPIAAFAYSLYELRRSVGEPTFREMARRVNNVHTNLSRASKGETFPTWETTREYVRACHADPAAWRPRWEAARRAVEEHRATVQIQPPPRRSEIDGGDRPSLMTGPSRQMLVIGASQRERGAHRRRSRTPTIRIIGLLGDVGHRLVAQLMSNLARPVPALVVLLAVTLAIVLIKFGASIFTWR